jgi:hypothetical protein
MVKSKQVLFHAIADKIKAKAKKVLPKEEYKRFLSVLNLIKARLLLVSFLPLGKLDLSKTPTLGKTVATY